jgi:hypothetical protein
VDQNYLLILFLETDLLVFKGVVDLADLIVPASDQLVFEALQLLGEASHLVLLLLCLDRELKLFGFDFL